MCTCLSALGTTAHMVTTLLVFGEGASSAVCSACTRFCIDGWWCPAVQPAKARPVPSGVYFICRTHYSIYSCTTYYHKTKVTAAPGNIQWISVTSYLLPYVHVGLVHKDKIGLFPRLQQSGYYSPLRSKVCPVVVQSTPYKVAVSRAREDPRRCLQRTSS